MLSRDLQSIWEDLLIYFLVFYLLITFYLGPTLWQTLALCQGFKDYMEVDSAIQLAASGYHLCPQDAQCLADQA